MPLKWYYSMKEVLEIQIIFEVKNDIESQRHKVRNWLISKNIGTKFTQWYIYALTFRRLSWIITTLVILIHKKAYKWRLTIFDNIWRYISLNFVVSKLSISDTSIIPKWKAYNGPPRSFLSLTTLRVHYSLIDWTWKKIVGEQ